MTSNRPRALDTHGISRVAMLSMHTSPFAQPGIGDAGGMNIYVANVARALAARGVSVDCYTLDTSGRAGEPNGVASLESNELATDLAVHSVHLPQAAGAAKEDLPPHIDAWTAAIAEHVGGADVLHSHYWLSGIAGLQIRQSIGVPLVHTMHTIGAVKNRQSDSGSRLEPQIRLDAELRIGREADQLTANTADEAADLVEFCGADAQRIAVVPPGIDNEIFNPSARNGSRRAFGLDDDQFVISFVGRLQPHKGPDVAIATVGAFLTRSPKMRNRTRLLMCGGASGAAGFSRADLAVLADAHGIGDRVDFIDPRPSAELARLYGASDVVLVPSVSESFGLVALEAQACGTPVIATAQGGLNTAVLDGRSGLLIATRDADDWAAAIARMCEADLRLRMSAAAADHARDFTWSRTAEQLLERYGKARL